MKESIIKEIVNQLKEINPLKVILFGSYAYGKHDEMSDIDLVVILNKAGMSLNYKEIRKNKKIVADKIQHLRKQVPIDILVYTKDEWLLLLESGSSFINKINKSGMVLL